MSRKCAKHGLSWTARDKEKRSAAMRQTVFVCIIYAFLHFQSISGTEITHRAIQMAIMAL